MERNELLSKITVTQAEDQAEEEGYSDVEDWACDANYRRVGIYYYDLEEFPEYQV